MTTKEIYQSWLSDRGLEMPPVAQPFFIIDSQMTNDSRTLILAASTRNNSAEASVSMARLASALGSALDPVSWILCDSIDGIQAPEMLLKLYPQIQYVIHLSIDPTITTQYFDVATPCPSSRKPVIIHGPLLDKMNNNQSIKRSFWIALQEWILENIKNK